ncbi:hypothetical protein [Actinomadura alba]|uniref:Uncharacterized protein n=1 Tax=Actinomadura alba TaxID=406431 RepID=A0ABR7LRL3_9ACTN|nr:hypothetical protein [Actinomadura alba]MBC6467142.1 hypothetical protein [Actinomadura alba]
MDPITTSALVAVLTKVFDGASGEAGRATWSALTTLVRNAFGGRSEPAEATGELERQPGDPARIEAVAASLAAQARLDPEFADELRHWLEDAQRPSSAEGDTINVVGGSAEIGGNVVQARDISGGIGFGDRA